MRRIPRYLTLTYGIVAYAGFLVTFVYAIGFLQRVGVPEHIDQGPRTPTAAAVAIDLGLLGLFAVQHSVMARRGFKRWWARYVPPAVERSTFVLAATLALALLLWQWRPLPTTVWDVEPTATRFALDAVGWLGWATVLGTTFLLNHFELFGLQQVYRNLRNRGPAEPVFRTPLLYRLVRHPLMLGFVLAFWGTPTMSQGKLLFAGATTGYILVALQLEERDLLAQFGEDYARYRRRVPKLVPGLKRPVRAAGPGGLTADPGVESATAPSRAGGA